VPEPAFTSADTGDRRLTGTPWSVRLCAGTIVLSAARSAIKNNRTTAPQMTGIG
jgi:hypothetical protein